MFQTLQEYFQGYERYGICVPSSCSKSDVDILLSLMEDENEDNDDGDWINRGHVSSVINCQDAEGETHELTPGDKGFM